MQKTKRRLERLEVTRSIPEPPASVIHTIWALEHGDAPMPPHEAGAIRRMLMNESRREAAKTVGMTPQQRAERAMQRFMDANS